MSKRSLRYAVRAIGHKEKSKWVVKMAASAASARKIAKKLARSKIGTYAPTVCIFDLKRWGKRPVCIRQSRRWGSGKYALTHAANKIHVVRYQPG